MGTEPAKRFSACVCGKPISAERYQAIELSERYVAYWPIVIYFEAALKFLQGSEPEIVQAVLAFDANGC